MQTSSQTFAQKAPSLYARRITRLYSHPVAQILFITILARLSTMLGTPHRIITLWWVFTFLAILAQDLVTADSWFTARFYQLSAYLGLKPNYASGLTEVNQVFSIYPLPPLFPYRHRLRWVFPLLVLLSLWFMAPYQSYLVTTGSLYQKAFVILLFYSAGLLPYGLIMTDRMRYATRFRKYAIWLTLGIVGCTSGIISFRLLTANWYLIILTALFFVTLYTSLFVSQRDWVGERELNEVLRTISLSFLTSSNPQKKLANVPDTIRTKLQHDRVFILIPSTDQQNLHIIGESGYHKSLHGHTIPIGQSLTGTAYTRKDSIVRNNVTVCPFYYPVDAMKDTKAEIAVPIKHQDGVFAILDVQSNRLGAYSPGDVAVLEAIAAILGAAIAVQKRDELFGEAMTLWEQLTTASASTAASERIVFEMFAHFVQEKFEADLITYYPLSLTGYPAVPPYRAGDFRHQEHLRHTLHDANSALIQLIRQWEPYYATESDIQSLNNQFPLSRMANFIAREEVLSTCFIPVGTQREKLGALFLNFRKPRTFDTVFKFTIMSLVQSLAEVAAQVRSRHILFESFGRPELGLHSLIGRHGLKNGLQQNAAMLWSSCQGDCCPSFQECVLGQMCQQTEAFIQDVYLADSSIPPNFWEESLCAQLEHYRNFRPSQQNGRRPRFNMHIDPQIEDENAWVKLALYRVITEAASNAMTYADPKSIIVSISRQQYTIELHIENDGRPFPKNAYNHRSRHGIFTLLQQLHDNLGAQTSIGQKSDGQGTVVHISLPAIPLCI